MISILCVLMDTESDPCFARHAHIETIPLGPLMGKKLLIFNLTVRLNGQPSILPRQTERRQTAIVEIEKADGEEPVWSPDGTEIAYVVRDEIRWASRQIRFINLKTDEQETLQLEGDQRMFQPAWSPTHNKIAFVWHRQELGQQSIFIVNRDGSGLQQIVDAIVVVPGRTMLTWSPSGDELVYSQSVGGKFQIFKINVVTLEITQLTHEGSNYVGNWFDPLTLSVSPQPQLFKTTWGEIKGQD